MRVLVPVVAVVASITAAPARADIDCAQCRAACNSAAGRAYPEDVPEPSGAALTHASKEAEAAFLDGRARDPSFGGRDAAGAVRDYKRAVVLDADNAAYRNHLAGALLLTGNVDEAIYNLETATKLVPAEGKFLVNLGYAHHKKGDEARAMLYYLRGLLLDPRDVRARLFLGYALEVLGYTNEAVAEHKKVMSQDPKNEGARRALVRLGALAPRATSPAGEPPPPLH